MNFFQEKFVFEYEWYYPFVLSDLNYSYHYLLQNGKDIKTTNILHYVCNQSIKKLLYSYSTNVLAHSYRFWVIS